MATHRYSRKLKRFGSERSESQTAMTSGSGNSRLSRSDIHLNA
jgi:hypothetical protein